MAQQPKGVHQRSPALAEAHASDRYNGRPPRNTILIGDVRQRLAELPAASIDTVITSPPYFGLRDYGHHGQLGLEASVMAWVDQLREVCRGLARVLKPTGSLWLNVGDSYSDHQRQGAAKKCLLLGPQRLALALVADGWIVRNQVVWAKTNPMPSSVTDRLSCTYEVLFFLVRNRFYFFDLDAIRVAPASGRRPERTAASGYPPPAAVPPARYGLSANHGLARLKATGRVAHPFGKNPGDVWHLPTAGYRGAHFATFPLRLVERPLLATCPERSCARCGTPHVRSRLHSHGATAQRGRLQARCLCRGSTMPGLTLDPFLGSGTVAMAAELHHRDWLGLELNPAYAALATERLGQWRTRRAHRARRTINKLKQEPHYARRTTTSTTRTTQRR